MKSLPLLMFVFLASLTIFICCGGNGDDDDAGDDDSAADDDDDDSAVDDDDDDNAPLELYGVEPRSGGASVAATVSLAGRGFADGLTVFVGAEQAEDVVVLSGTEARAVFPRVDLNQRGRMDVTVFLGEQTSGLKDAFEYVFDEDPVVMVHGFDGDDFDFDDITEWFLELGYPEDSLFAVDFSDNLGSVIPEASDELPAFVDQVLQSTGASKVDIIAHSMGSLAARLWIKEYGGHDKVRDFVSIAGANHGSTTACALQWWGEGMKELCPSYADEEHSYNGVQWTLNGDPDTEDVDETPYGVEDGGEIYWMGALYSNADIVIIPQASCCLNQSHINDCSHPINVRIQDVAHNPMIHNEEVFDLVQGMIREHNPSKP